MSGDALAVAIASKEREADAVRVRIDALESRLAASSLRRKDVGELLGEGEDGLPLATPPLHAALVGAVAANGAMFFAYVVFLVRFREMIWNALLVLALVLAVGSLPFSSRPGAGGHARIGLRRFALAGIVAALVGVAFAFLHR